MASAKGRTVAEFEPLLPAELTLLSSCAAGTVAKIGADRPEYLVAMFWQPEPARDPWTFFSALAAALPKGKASEAVARLAEAPWKRLRRRQGALGTPARSTFWWVGLRPGELYRLPDDLNAPIAWQWAEAAANMRGWRIPHAAKRAWLATRQMQQAVAQRRVRAGFVRCLALGDENAPLHEHGVHIRGAWIDGGLEFSGADLPRRLVLHNCHVAGVLNLGSAQVPSVNLGGSRVSGVVADGLKTRGAVSMYEGFFSSGIVRMVGARIGTDVNCRGARLNCSEADNDSARTLALALDGAEITGYVYLNAGFRARGAVRLVGTRVRGDVVCNGGRFEHARLDADGEALMVNRANIDGSLFLSRLLSDETAPVFVAKGVVVLVGAKIGRDLRCTNGQFHIPRNPKGPHIGKALRAEQATVGGAALLNKGFRAVGTVDFTGIKVSSDLDCSDGAFSATRGAALLLDRSDISGSLLLNRSDDATAAQRAGFTSRGMISIAGAKIGGDLKCDGGSFIGRPGSTAISLDDTTIKRLFVFRDVAAVTGIVSLAGLKIDALSDDAKSWSATENVVLDGFVFEQIAGENASTEADDRIAWLRRQKDMHLKQGFRPQPWEQVIRVLRKMGHDEAAKQVAIAKKRQLCDSGKLTGSAYLRQVLYRYLYGFGHRPAYLFGWVVLFATIGSVLFTIGESAGVMGPTDGRIRDDAKYQHCRPDNFGNWTDCPALANAYSTFNPILYSIDLILPVINLQQAKDWAPLTRFDCEQVGRLGACARWWPAAAAAGDPRHAVRPAWSPFGWFLWFYARFVNVFGWLAGLWFVGVISGLVKKD